MKFKDTVFGPILLWTIIFGFPLIALLAYIEDNKKSKAKEKHSLACQIGYRLAVLDYKKPIHTKDVPEIKKRAKYQCADWVIEGFIERHSD